MNTMRKPLFVLGPLLGAALASGAALHGCGGSKQACTIGDAMSCPPDKTCEGVTQGSSTKNQCFSPTGVKGKVADAQTNGPIGGARVILWNMETLKIVGTTTTSTVGYYEIHDTIPRVQGQRLLQRYGLRVSAPGYLDYPGGVRTGNSLALSLGMIDAEGTVQSVNNTDLQALPAPHGGGISGKVTGGPAGAAVLVVAEGNGQGYSGVVDATGAFTLHDLPSGSYEVRGYLQNQSYGPATVTVGDAVASADLPLASSDGAKVTGKAMKPADNMQCLPPGVVVAVKSTGEFVPGVRADLAADGGYMLTGVPAGPLVVLVSQENDCLIRDPNSAEADGIEHNFAAGETFDATAHVVPLINALDMRGPGRDSEESFGIDTLKWNYDTDADQYSIEVFDVFGKPLMSMSPVLPATVPAAMVPMEGGTLSIDLAIKPGIHYKWRATASKGGKILTRTEDLRGQFYKIRQ